MLVLKKSPFVVKITPLTPWDPSPLGYWPGYLAWRVVEDIETSVPRQIITCFEKKSTTMFEKKFGRLHLIETVKWIFDSLKL